MRHRDPQLGDSNQHSRYWRPEADKKKYAGACTNDVRHSRCGERRVCELDKTEADQHDCSYMRCNRRPAPGQPFANVE